MNFLTFGTLKIIAIILNNLKNLKSNCGKRAAFNCTGIRARVFSQSPNLTMLNNLQLVRVFQLC